jgi:putative ABC transport system ATP-binding protein
MSDSKSDSLDSNTTAEKPTALIRVSGLTKTFTRGGETLEVLKGLDLEIMEGSFEALMGPSGSGKSTLLNLLAGLDRPSGGTIEVAGQRIDTMNESQLAYFRSQTVGFVFQSFNLIPVLTAAENVELPLLLTKLSSAERKTRAQTALRVVGLEDRMHHLPKQLSGGQEQRVAIARAIVHDPRLIVADEPTGDLDRNSADEVLRLLTKLSKELKKTILMVTHDPQAAASANIQRHMNKGRLEGAA